MHFYYSKNETNPSDGKPKRIKEKRALDIAECSNQYFKYDDQEQVTEYSIDKQMCIKT